MHIDDFRKALLTSVKPDLNRIFTTPQFTTATGLDFGWHCSEHAYLVFLFARLLGFPCEIVLGDIHVTDPGIVASTLGVQGDHAWCRIEQVVPVDISVSLEHFDCAHNVDLVFANSSELFSVNYHKASDAQPPGNGTPESGLQISYYELERLTPDPIKLAEDPYSFLLPPSNNQLKFTDRYGPDVFKMITMHLYKIAVGKAKPVFSYLDAERAIRRISQWNSDADEQIRRLLETSNSYPPP